ncbi:uncharacterized protein LOC111670480 [Seriola lalandi dorsalis]|uniref:uncharacterized protein LOC111670480 n=1 Tax=Seriola lalandi dorsalis TaxID=1841481 RepID=UPI000C6FB1BA|nr:uncharacterized protein LOC111670480 [Seriola lalandi dorsalis]XP_023282972.1 uncharacterized protein LOC111670480 [Seriola lalandi dorsalis]
MKTCRISTYQAQSSSKMEIQQQNKLYLAAIQEESEQEDEIGGSKTGENEEYSRTQVGVDTEEVMTEDESEEEEDDVPLRVLRPRRLSRSSSQESFVPMPPANNDQEETQNSSVSDTSSRTEDFRDEATTPGQPEVENGKQSSRRELAIKISKIRWQKHTPPKPSVKKRRTNETRRKEPSVVKNVSKADPLPPWLVDLMVNIEEATTHQLVVE